VLAELPEKIVQDRECELSLLQRQLYQMVVDFCSLNARDVGRGISLKYISGAMPKYIFKKNIG
jgi:SNF2 family DNA or RNA helicase